MAVNQENEMESDTNPFPFTGPFGELVGYEIFTLPDGRWALRLELEDKHLNQHGIGHGGVALTLMDAAGGVAIYGQGVKYRRIATISMSMNFLGATTPGLVTAVGTVERVGQAVAYTSMSLHQGDENGPLVGSAQGAYRLFRQDKA